MKTVSKDKIEKAERLAALIEMRKEIEKEEKALKDFFKTEIDVSSFLEAGNVLITIEQCQRAGIDKNLLIAELGSGYKKFETVTEYQQVTVKKVA